MDISNNTILIVKIFLSLIIYFSFIPISFYSIERFKMSRKRYRRNIKKNNEEELNLKQKIAYWKKFEGYQVGILFYDFRVYRRRFNIPDRISIRFECIFSDIDCSIDLSVSKDVSIEEFEIMAKAFTDTMFKFTTKN